MMYRLYILYIMVLHAYICMPHLIGSIISRTSKSSVYQGFVQLIIFQQENLQIKLGFVHESHHPQCCYHRNIMALFETGNIFTMRGYGPKLGNND